MTILLLQLKVIFFGKSAFGEAIGPTDNNSMLLTYGGQLIVFAICFSVLLLPVIQQKGRSS